jgi:hypothetical protein
MTTNKTSKATVDAMAALLSSVQDTVGVPLESYITNFLISPTSANYSLMKTMIASQFLPDAKKISTSARILVAESDGSVVYDSKQTPAVGTDNNLFTNIRKLKTTPTADNIIEYLINENHASRTSYLAAMLSTSGRAYTIKPSNSTGTLQFYVALRMGASSYEPYGVVIISCDII